MKKLAICLCAFGLLLAGPVRAENDCSGGWYAGVKLGVSFEQHGGSAFGMDAATETAQGVAYSWDHHRVGMGDISDSVFSGGVNFGYDFSRRFDLPFRLELDYTLRGNASDTAKKTAAFNVNVGGAPVSFDSELEVKTSLRLQTAMLNAWYDIPTGTDFSPYVGGGLGLAFIRHKSTAIENPGTAEAEIIQASENFSNFAWSLGGGLAYQLNDRWTLDLGYRYLNAGDHKMHYQGEGSVMYTDLDKIESHDIMLGARYSF